MSRRAALLLLALVVVSVGGLALVNLPSSPSPTKTRTPATTAAVATARAALGSTAPATPTRAPTADEIRILARVGVAISTGPTVAIQGDPDTTALPTARDLGALGRLPADWAHGMVVATESIEGLATPDAHRGTMLSKQLATPLYQQWLKRLQTAPNAGLFTISHLALASTNTVSANSLPVSGVGVYTSGTTRARYFVVAEVVRTPSGWLLQSASYTPMEA